MNVKKNTLTFLIIASMITVFATNTIHASDSAIPVFSNAIVKVGSSGADVKEMQGRLKFLGFYTGPVDGTFSWRCYWALRNFQYEFGLKVDGVLGPKTKLKLWSSTKNWKPGGTTTARPPATSSGGGGTAGTTATKPSLPATNYGFSANDIKLMANAVYGEARGEAYIGQVAVAAVILNRIKNSSFPNTVSGVIFEPGAFTAVADGQIWFTPNETAKKAVQDAMNGWDPTNGAIYYFNPATATSKWIWSRPQIKKIGKHIFCR